MRLCLAREAVDEAHLCQLRDLLAYRPRVVTHGGLGWRVLARSQVLLHLSLLEDGEEAVVERLVLSQEELLKLVGEERVLVLKRRVLEGDWVIEVCG